MGRNRIHSGEWSYSNGATWRPCPNDCGGNQYLRKKKNTWRCGLCGTVSGVLN